MKTNCFEYSVEILSVYYFIPGILIVCLLLISCKNERLSNSNPAVVPVVYMPQAVNNPVIVNLPMADTAQTVVYGANYGGVKSHSKIKVHFKVNKALVDSFNVNNNTHYTLLPSGSYSLEKNAAFIPAGKRATKPLTLSVKTYKHLQPNTKYLLPISLISEQSGVAINKSISTTYYVIEASFQTTTVFMPRGSKNATILNVPLESNSQTITYSAKYKGASPGSSLAIGFKVDPSLTKAFNSAHGTHVPPMPKGSYQLLKKTGTIPEGKDETQQLKIKLRSVPSMSLKQLRVGYLLPVRITNISGEGLTVVHKLILNKNKSTVYFLITERNYIPLTFNTTNHVHQMSVNNVVTKLGNNTYSFEITGVDPHIRTVPLSEDIGSHTVLTFEYKCSPPGEDEFALFFAPISATRLLFTGPLPAANSWTLHKVNIGQSVKKFSWGNKGDFLRVDFGHGSGVKIQIRNLRLVKK